MKNPLDNKSLMRMKSGYATFLKDLEEHFGPSMVMFLNGARPYWACIYRKGFIMSISQEFIICFVCEKRLIMIMTYTLVAVLI